MAENKKSPMKLGPAAALALAQGIKAGVQIFQGFQQRADARRALDDAETLAENRMRSYENFDFRIQNPYEDLTASTEAQQLANQQQAQQQANTLARLQQGATGAGAASLATAIARQGAKQAQAAQALTAKQEAANERLAAGAQLKIDAAVSAKEQRRQEVLTSLALQDQAVQQKLLNDANAAITGGVGNLVAAGIEYAGGVDPKDKEELDDETVNVDTNPNNINDLNIIERKDQDEDDKKKEFGDDYFDPKFDPYNINELPPNSLGV